MLADRLDYVVGVDPHPDSRSLAVVDIVSGSIVYEAMVNANSDGYAQALKLVDEHARGRRAFAVEGTGSFGAGLTRFLYPYTVFCERDASGRWHEVSGHN
jgi:transposase